MPLYKSIQYILLILLYAYSAVEDISKGTTTNNNSIVNRSAVNTRLDTIPNIHILIQQYSLPSTPLLLFIYRIGPASICFEVSHNK